MRWLLAMAVLGGCADTRPMIVVLPDGASSEIQPCASGCSAPTPDETAHISDAAIAAHLQKMAEEPLGSESLSVETLLFHGTDTLAYLERADTPLDPTRMRWLRRELARDTVTAEFRLVGAMGQVYGSIDEHFPLVEKQHLRLDTADFGQSSVNGKVKRVGVKHLWARF